MTASQNGFRVLESNELTRINVPGGQLTCRAQVAEIFTHLATRFHNEVENLIWPGCWGWAARTVRGSSDISNHASGTAIDLNAPRHVLGTDPTASFTTAQIAKIREIVAFYEGVIRWGGAYVGRKDSMHFEVNDGVTLDQLARITAKLHAPAPAPVVPPQPAPVAAGRPTIQRGATGGVVWDLQRKLTSAYSLYNKYTPNGVFGPATEAGVREFQKRSGLVSDGIVGPRTWKALGL